MEHISGTTYALAMSHNTVCMHAYADGFEGFKDYSFGKLLTLHHGNDRATAYRVL